MKVIIAETIDWETSVRIGSHHYAAQFLKKGCEVLWLSQCLHPLSLFTGDWERKRRVSRLLRGAAHPRHDGLTLYTPFSLLPCRRRVLDNARVGHNILRYTVPPARFTLRRLGFDKVDVVWISNPLHVGLTDIVKYRVLVSRVNDLYAGFLKMPTCVKNLERTLLERSDLVYATSDVLEDHVRLLGKEPKRLSNGADFEHFNLPAPQPEDYKSIPAPRAIYVGAIEEWFDVDTLAATAGELPDVSFVLIGACSRACAAALANRRNVYLLGPKPYSQLPGYYQRADVGMIVFKINGLTKAVNPNKLYEYFASGLPVVSTALPEVARLEPLVRIANTPEEFAALIRNALGTGKNDPLAEQRLQCARTNSWETRFQEAWEDIGEILSETVPIENHA